MLPIGRLDGSGKCLRFQTARGHDVLRYDGEGLSEFLNYLTLEYLVDMGVTEGREPDQQFHFEFFPVRAWEDPDSPIVAFSVEDPGLLGALGIEGEELFIHSSRDLVWAILDYRNRLMTTRRQRLLERTQEFVDEAELTRRLVCAQQQGHKVLTVCVSDPEAYRVQPEDEDLPPVDMLPLVDEITVFPMQIAVIKGLMMDLYVEDVEIDGFIVVELPSFGEDMVALMEHFLRRDGQFEEVYE